MKDIPGFGERFSATEDGKIWSHFSSRFLNPVKDRKGYLYIGYREDGKVRRVSVHRLVAFAFLGLSGKTKVDHIDFNPSNNCVSNLRLVNDSQSSAHTRIRKDNPYGFKGVFFNKANNNWRAVVSFMGIKHYAGSFENIIEAARQRDVLAKKLHGDYAITNY